MHRQALSRRLAPRDVVDRVELERPRIGTLNETVLLDICEELSRPVGSAGLEARSTTGVGVSAASLAMPRFLPAQRADVYTRSTSSSYIDSASAGPALIAAVAQYFRWFRISSRPTERNASCTDEIWVMMSAQ